MALHIFTVFAEAPTDDLAFQQAKKSPLMMGRTKYQFHDGGVLHPSDAHAARLPEWVYGVQPQEDRVDIAGADTNTVWAVRVRTTNQGMKRIMFFGVRRQR